MTRVTKTSKLVPIVGIKSTLVYDLQGLEGAMRYPFACPQVVECLMTANNYLAQFNSAQRNVEILVWDAYRTRQTQQAIYIKYVQEIIEQKGIKFEDAYVIASSFVSVPTTVFPHGTGGAIDVTLLINGEEAPMGTGFDEFIAEAAPDWYINNPPQNDIDLVASENRALLRAAMEYAGFVGLESEWWHFEWGTTRWAEATDNAVLFDSILQPPQVTGPSYPDPSPPHRQPMWQLGAAQVFTDPDVRAAALYHTDSSHYYARTSHPTTEGLGKYVKRAVLPSKHICFTATGIAACTTALKSLIPVGGCLIYDTYIYYEVEREILSLATELNWKLVRVDFNDAPKLEEATKGYESVDVLYCDTPRNWWLDSIDIESVLLVAKRVGALLVVDSSVQPLQNLLGAGVDVVACSLSKYPSTGLTLGGMLLCDETTLENKLSASITRLGNNLSPDAAMTIWSQMLSLKDRMFAVSHKAERVVEFLRSHKVVRQVRIPDKRCCGGLIGGQISFHVRSYELGVVLEKIIGHNSLTNQSSLHLACTFGSSMTTFEHFASNRRHRVGTPREATNEVALPSDIIRLGIGCEDVHEIISQLNFILDAGALYVDS